VKLKSLPSPCQQSIMLRRLRKLLKCQMASRRGLNDWKPWYAAHKGNWSLHFFVPTLN
jgi:hypothetical protein